MKFRHSETIFLFLLMLVFVSEVGGKRIVYDVLISLYEVCFNGFRIYRVAVIRDIQNSFYKCKLAAQFGQDKFFIEL